MADPGRPAPEPPAADPAPGGSPELLRHAADGCARALRLVPGARRWTERHGLLLATDVLPQVALAAVFCCPAADDDSLALTTRTLTWMYALDDLSDDRSADARAVVATLGRCGEVLRDGAPRDAGSGDRMAEALAGLWAGVRDGGPPALAELWRAEATALLLGTLREREWADGTRPPPSLEEYLATGTRTIGVALKVLTLWRGLGEPDLMDRLPALLPPLDHAARAVRLANDLSGHHVERARGIVDALTLGLSRDRAEDGVRHQVARCRDALRPALARGEEPARVVERAALWSLRLYDDHYAGRDPGRDRGRPDPA
ncbi:terpene synthase family protein [Streptomyces sp. NPDC000594]|uniref:terpene synthase family protein n=1 Tax=Streptomyces sp. NPDC000594 TaxID=3154261 RepID=UPI003331852F